MKDLKNPPTLNIKLENLSELKNSKVLLGFSHGIDSTALFHLLRESRVEFACALINYKTRAQSDDEQSAARALCQKYGAPFFSKVVCINSGNFESKARDERYSFFYELCKAQGFDTLVLAHQLNDLFEWFLMRMAKGAGLVNALGFSPWQKRQIAPDFNIFISRPLIYTSRDEILEYLHSNNYEYFIDSSNLDEKYSRNYIRHNYSNSFVRDNFKGLVASFKAMERDKDVLLGKFIYQKDGLFVLRRSASEFNLIDKACKCLGVVISAKTRDEISREDALVVSHKIAIAKNDDFVYICPFLKLSMPKDFKDRCRLLKIPALIRPYLHTRIELLDEIVGINNTD